MWNVATTLWKDLKEYLKVSTVPSKIVFLQILTKNFRKMQKIMKLLLFVVTV